MPSLRLHDLRHTILGRFWGLDFGDGSFCFMNKQKNDKLFLEVKMPRKARIKSNTGIYHIMTKGINKEKIFQKEVHKNKVIEIIKYIKEEMEISIIAYCVMDNHFHLLFKADEEKLKILIKKLNVKYAMYYNKFEDRNGHVFQDRFRSEAVQDDTYMLGVLRYIHNNSVKAKMVKDILEYKWSSANEYIDNKSDLISSYYLSEILDLFNNKKEF